MRFELDTLLLRLLVPSLLAALLVPNEACDEVRPHRTGLSDARNEVVFDDAPEKRERPEDDDEPADGVLRPDEPRLLVALLMKS